MARLLRKPPSVTASGFEEERRIASRLQPGGRRFVLQEILWTDEPRGDREGSLDSPFEDLEHFGQLRKGASSFGKLEGGVYLPSTGSVESQESSALGQIAHRLAAANAEEALNVLSLQEWTQVLSPDRFRHGQQRGTPAKRLGI